MSRSQWGSRAGFILASAGSAIGLGAVWKFPYITATQGGGSFLFIYLICCLVLGLTLMATEMALGRAAHSSPIGAFRKLGNPGWALTGVVGVLVAFLILSFYSVVGGWTVAYLVKSITGGIATSIDPKHNSEAFVQFITDPWSPIVYHFIFGLLTFGIVIFGVEKGIERISKYLMSLLLVLMLLLILRNLTLPGAWEGVEFFLTPDFSKVTKETWLEAMGLSFFSLSLGIGIMITYGSYVDAKSNLISSSAWVIGLTLLTCILAGFMVLPAVFAFGFEPSAGPGLTFITMPAVFASMPFSGFFATLFFVLLLVAALTSSISLLEVMVSFFIDELKLSRYVAGIISFALFFIVGCTASLSLGVWDNPAHHIFGLNIFDFLDKLTQNILMPLGEVSLTLFCAWVAWKSHLAEQLFSSAKLANLFRLMLGVVVPVIIVAVFVVNVIL